MITIHTVLHGQKMIKNMSVFAQTIAFLLSVIAAYVAATTLTVCALLVASTAASFALLGLLAGFIALVGFDHFRAAAIVSIIIHRFMENHCAAAELLADEEIADQVEPDFEGTV